MRPLTLLALFASFVAGVLVDGWLRTYGPPQPVLAAAQTTTRPARRTAEPTPPPAANQVAEPPAKPTIGAGTQSATGLRVPIDGITIESLKGGFSESRGSHPHEAVDIVVPRGTPIHAVQDGTIAKLFLSNAGGMTIYQFDPDERLCFYYAHLERYADGLREGQRVSQGEVIGYVGTSGNAPPETPHLHFAIFELDADRKWWQGRPLDPYLVFKDKG